MCFSKRIKSVRDIPASFLIYATLTYDSAYGRVKSSWRRENGVSTYTVSIPANTTATLLLPNGEHKLCAGEYEFTV